MADYNKKSLHFSLFVDFLMLVTKRNKTHLFFYIYKIIRIFQESIYSPLSLLPAPQYPLLGIK